MFDDISIKMFKMSVENVTFKLLSKWKHQICAYMFHIQCIHHQLHSSQIDLNFVPIKYLPQIHAIALYECVRFWSRGACFSCLRLLLHFHELAKHAPVDDYERDERKKGRWLGVQLIGADGVH